MLEGKKILLGITGSIAAYKSATLVRLLVKAGAEVKVLMTPSAKQFITPLTLSTLAQHKVLSDLSDGESWANHVMLGRWADVMLIAPMSCNTLSKMAAGNCDNLLLAVYLSATCPVVVAPAMDEDMWLHRSTKNNLSTITSFGNLVIPVDSGELASGLVGEGRMAEPPAIIDWLDQYFSTSLPLKGHKALVTAGPTYEAIDPVRFIGNHSTGKMGVAIARVLKEYGAAVTLVLGPSSIEVPQGITTVRVESAEDMYNACVSVFDEMSIAVLSAAVADFTPVNVADEKIKKASADLTVVLKQTNDILKHLGSIKKSNQLLVGFALETTNETANAQKKLAEKKADMIVLNSLNDAGAGFGHDSNKVTIFHKNGTVQSFETKDKTAVAVDIVNSIVNSLP